MVTSIFKKFYHNTNSCIEIFITTVDKDDYHYQHHTLPIHNASLLSLLVIDEFHELCFLESTFEAMNFSCYKMDCEFSIFINVRKYPQSQ